MRSVGILDGVAACTAPKWRTPFRADSAFGAQDWSSLKVRNGLKHKVVVDFQFECWFRFLSPSFTYDQYDSFQSLDVSEVQVTEDSRLRQRHLQISVGQRMAFGVTASTRFYGTFNARGRPGEGRAARLGPEPGAELQPGANARAAWSPMQGRVEPLCPRPLRAQRFREVIP